MKDLLDLLALTMIDLGFKMLSDERFDVLYVRMRDDFRG